MVTRTGVIVVSLIFAFSAKSLESKAIPGYSVGWVAPACLPLPTGINVHPGRHRQLAAKALVS